MSSSLLRYLILALVTAVALWLRTADLASRPMHADEANQAVKLGELIETGRYAFDPSDHHGPTLYYAALPIAWSRGETTLASLTETTVRLVPAIAGTLAVLLLAALAAPGVAQSERWDSTSGRVVSMRTDTQQHPPGGRIPPRTNKAGQNSPSNRDAHWLPLIAAALLAVSPPAVYYSRYFIQETLLVTFTLAALVCAQRWWRHGHPAWAIAAGVCAGAMQATKASAPLFVGAALVALAVAQMQRLATHRPGRDFFLALFAALAVAALFYSSFGSNPAGLRDAFSVYGPAWQRASAGAGHEKPWWYYLQLFGWQKNGGLLWHQLIFTALALTGAALAFTRQHSFYRWVAVYTLTITAVLSLTPYKTPWHAIHLVPGMAVLAASAIGALPRRWLAIAVTFLVLTTQLIQTRLAAFTRPADLRNPYAYVHSVPDVLKFRHLVDAAVADSPRGVVRVIGEEYWPIPWYLRGLPQVGYWSEPAGDCDGVLVIATGAQAEAVRARLHGNYRETYLGLRPGVLCVVFTRQP